MRHIYMNSPDPLETDVTLVAQALAGEREAFGSLVGRYYASVLQLCVRLLRDPVEAQDVAQESILQAFLGLDRLQQPDRFGAWLHAIAANLARSSLRRQRPASFDGLEAAEYGRLRREGLFPSLEQVVAMRQTHEAIIAALMDISVVNREAVVAYYLQGYTYAELADLLDVPVSTVKSRLFKGRQQLRQRLKDLRQPVLFPSELSQKESPMAPELIPLQVELICEYTFSQRSIVVLRTLAGDLYLPIRLMRNEALSIELALKRQPDALPITIQDTLLQAISDLGGHIEQVVLKSVTKQNYYASLIVSKNGQDHEVACRLSEALTLAVRAQIPVLSAPGLLEEAGIAIEIKYRGKTIPEAELLDSVERVTASNQWPDTFVEQIWSLLLSVLSGHQGSQDLSNLRELAWDELFPAREVDWEGKTMQLVPLPAAEPAWLVVRPELWTQVNRFVKWVQRRETPYPAEPSPIFIPLIGEQQKQLEQSLEAAWPVLTDLGARSLILIHLSGDLVAWKSLDSFKTAVRMGQAALKDLILTQQLNALVDATAEPGIKITYERNSAFNPAQAAATSVVSTSEVLIHQSWLLVVGWASDQQQVEQQLAQVWSSLEGILPG